MLLGRKEIILLSIGTPFIIMRRRTIMFAPWDSGWIRYQRTSKKQNPVTNKLIANTGHKTVWDAPSEVHVLQVRIIALWSAIILLSITNKKRGKLYYLK